MSQSEGVVVHRRLHHQPTMLKVDLATNKVIGPTSAAFHPDSDGLSVYFDQVLRNLGLGPSDVRIDLSQCVAGLTEHAVAEAGLTIVEDPVEEAPEKVGAAHALIQGWTSLTGKAKVRTSRKLASAAVCTWPGGTWDTIPPPARE
jgi:hypothetical protein